MKTTLLRLLLLLRCAPGLLLATAALAESAPDTTSATPAPRIEKRIVVRTAQEAQQAAMQALDAQQIAADAQTVARQAASGAQQAMQAQGDMAFIHSELAQFQVTKGAPYCADAVHESIQTLVDGNRIVRSQTTRLCRDGEGRTRQEVERDGHHIIYLRDPVAKQSWLLDVQHKSARRFGAPTPLLDSAAWQVYAEQMREWAHKVKAQVRAEVATDMPASPPSPPAPPSPPRVTPPPPPPTPVVLSQSDTSSTDARGREHRELRVQVLRVDPPPVPGPMHGALPALPPLPAIQPPPMVVARAMVLAPRGPGVQSSLGSKELAGVKVNGERTSWTIEAGKIGNEKPIVITRDVWTSPELMITVASRDFDPVSGESNYRLQDLKRGEPDPALMKVPADYTLLQPQGPAQAVQRQHKKD